MNTGAPISAMMAPTGSSRGAARVRLSISARHSSTPPPRVAAGRDDAVIAGAEPQAYEMGRDQADKADHAAADHGQRGQRRTQQEDRHARAAALHPDGGTAHLPGAQHIEPAARERRDGQRGRQCDQLNQGRCAQPRSPASQKTMPRS